MTEVTLPTEGIRDWESFHAVSSAAFGFPHFYGCNNNAWIDCLSDLTEPDGMSGVVLGGEERLLVIVPGFRAFLARAPGIAAGLLECAAAVNARYIARGDIPRLALVLA